MIVHYHASAWSFKVTLINGVCTVGRVRTNRGTFPVRFTKRLKIITYKYFTCAEGNYQGSSIMLSHSKGITSLLYRSVTTNPLLKCSASLDGYRMRWGRDESLSCHQLPQPQCSPSVWQKIPFQTFQVTHVVRG